MRQALAHGAPDDVATVAEALRGAPDGPPPAGDWACRVAKLGGATRLVVYGNFACRVTTGEAGWRVEKLTGSQRFTGKIVDRDDAFVFAGVGHVGTTPATDYAGLPPGDQTPVEPNQTVAEIAIWETVSETRARLMFPYPLLESDFDLLILTRERPRIRLRPSPIPVRGRRCRCPCRPGRTCSCR